MLREIIKDNAWIHANQTGKYSALILRNEGRIRMICRTDDGTTEKWFNSTDEVESHLSDGSYFRKAVSAMRQSPKKEALAEVNGFPCNVETPHLDTDNASKTGLPVFTKAMGKGPAFAAGYYIWQGKTGNWSKGYCPKLDTLTNAMSYAGPYRSDMEMNAELKVRKS